MGAYFCLEKQTPMMLVSYNQQKPVSPGLYGLFYKYEHFVSWAVRKFRLADANGTFTLSVLGDKGSFVDVPCLRQTFAFPQQIRLVSASGIVSNFTFQYINI